MIPHILIVDDDPRVCASLTFELKELGYLTASCHSSEAALPKVPLEQGGHMSAKISAAEMDTIILLIGRLTRTQLEEVCDIVLAHHSVDEPTVEEADSVAAQMGLR